MRSAETTPSPRVRRVHPLSHGVWLRDPTLPQLPPHWPGLRPHARPPGPPLSTPLQWACSFLWSVGVRGDSAGLGGPGRAWRQEPRRAGWALRPPSGPHQEALPARLGSLGHLGWKGWAAPKPPQRSPMTRWAQRCSQGLAVVLSPGASKRKAGPHGWGSMGEIQGHSGSPCQPLGLFRRSQLKPGGWAGRKGG